MNSALTLMKALADETRLSILNALNEKDMYVELLAERLKLSAPTISFHMKKLMAAGLVDARREQYYTMYALRRNVLDVPLARLILSGDAGAAEDMREAQYRRKVICAFMPNGVCQTLPAQVKKRLIVYREIFERFDPARSYTEKEVNAIIAQVYADYCTVRRAFVGMGWMQRDRGVYTISPGPDFNDASGMAD